LLFSFLLMLTVLCRDVLRKLGQAKSLLASYSRIRATAHDPKSSPELANTRQDLDAILDDLTDLDDLDASVSAVEADPARYGLALEEVRRRRGFVDQVKDQVQDLKDASVSAYNSSQVRKAPICCCSSSIACLP
jgi:Syntaxin 6, N-terminal